jgi:hypothetical protein
MWHMLKTGLEFAPGTTDECKKLVTRLMQPEQILSAYRQARGQFSTGDLVLTISEQDPSGFEAESRIAYVKRAREMNKRVPLLMHGLAAQSAHKIAKLPPEAEALWLIIVRGPKAVPIMCVIFAVPYQTTAVAAPN